MEPVSSVLTVYAPGQTTSVALGTGFSIPIRGVLLSKFRHLCFCSTVCQVFLKFSADLSIGLCDISSFKELADTLEHWFHYAGCTINQACARCPVQVDNCSAAGANLTDSDNVLHSVTCCVDILTGNWNQLELFEGSGEYFTEYLESCCTEFESQLAVCTRLDDQWVSATGVMFLANSSSFIHLVVQHLPVSMTSMTSIMSSVRN